MIFIGSTAAVDSMYMITITLTACWVNSHHSKAIHVLHYKYCEASGGHMALITSTSLVDECTCSVPVCSYTNREGEGVSE